MRRTNAAPRSSGVDIMMSAGDSASAWLGPQGPFVAGLAGFAPREPQRLMADAVQQAMARFETLVCEAGTGTGKTLAYLVPALLSGRKVMVSTGTKTLQDQLFSKDLPLVRAVLNRPVETALLKGRANYLCRYRLAEACERFDRSQHDGADLARVRDWGAVTVDGDIGELTGIAEQAEVWSRVTSTPDNCLGSDCPQFDTCFVYKARRRAAQAELVVINHHLLCADLGLKEDGLGEILPAADAYVIDEAHQLAQVAAGFFGDSLTSRQLLDLARDAVIEQLRDARDTPAIATAAARLEKAVHDLRLALGSDSQRLPWRRLHDSPAMSDALSAVQSALAVLGEVLESAAARGIGLEQCCRRAQTQRLRLDRLRDETLAGQVRWLETHRRAFALHATPLDIAAEFQSRLPTRRTAWVFTSATLAVNRQFQHFIDALGLDSPQTLLLDSPFDFEANALLYLPESMPNPNTAHFTARVAAQAEALLRYSRGRAFLLFTSYRALRDVATRLRAVLDLPLLVQGEGPRAALLAQFRTTPQAVLLGTGSFWEGVDVRGEQLSLVLIDRLPFASPGDPVVQARVDAMRAQGMDAFMTYQLPHAVITLKQGAGRLIRDVSDRGVLVLCDPRLGARGYGKVFLDSLPAMRATRAIADVEAFFAEGSGGSKH